MNTPNAAGSKKKPGAVIPPFDGIRAVGVLCVIAAHCALYANYFHPHEIIFGPTLSSKVERLYYQIAESGWAIMDWFFVLSGFLITKLLVESKGKKTYFRVYFLRRTLRIFPAYYTFLILYFVALPLLLSPRQSRLSGLDANLTHQLWYWLHGSNIMLGYMPYFTGTLSHIWSLSLEVQFYIIWPFAVYFLSEARLLFFSLALFFATIILRFYLVWVLEVQTISLYYLLYTHFDSLAAGAILALLVRSDRRLVQLRKYAPLVSALSGSLFLALLTVEGQFAQHVSFNSKMGFQYTSMWMFGYTILAIFFGAVTVLLYTDTPSTPAQRFFSCKVMRFIGNISYAMYLYHLIVIAVLSPYFLRIRSLVGVPVLGVVIFTLTASVITVAVATLSWHLCEKHFLKARRHSCKL